jgi:hypothetical protein
MGRVYNIAPPALQFFLAALYSTHLRAANMSGLSKVGTHIKQIFTTGNGHYMNEHGETVYGKLPRVRVENPIKTLLRPTFMSKLLLSHTQAQSVSR